MKTNLFSILLNPPLDTWLYMGGENYSFCTESLCTLPR